MAQWPYVYLDYAASAPPCPEAREAERAYDASSYAGANPNSLHTPGRLAARALDQARATIVRCLGGGFRPADVTFTSGGTESNNLALLGLAEAARARDVRRRRVVVSAIEHDSVLDVMPQLKARGFDVAVAPVGGNGLVDAQALATLVDESVAVVSVMAANNETGAIQPLHAISSAAHAAGAVMHTDAVQAFGKVAFAFGDVDAISLAAHKLGGPVGVGALVVRGNVPIVALSWGGGQEHGRRAGTQDVRGALAFAAATQAACGRIAEAGEALRSLSEALIDALAYEGNGIVATLPCEVPRLPGIVHLLVSGVDSETLVLDLDEAGFAVSAGSACSAHAAGTSHVLAAMGLGRRAEGALRVSFDERVPKGDLDRFAESLLAVASRRRGGR